MRLSPARLCSALRDVAQPAAQTAAKTAAKSAVALRRGADAPLTRDGEKALMVTRELAGIRLDRFVRKFIKHLPQSLIERALREKQVRLIPSSHSPDSARSAETDHAAVAHPAQRSGRGGKRVESGYKVQPSDAVIIPDEWRFINFASRAKSALVPASSATNASALRKATSLDSIPHREEILEDLQHRVLFEDEYCIVLNKPPCLPVQGGMRVGALHLAGLLHAFTTKTSSLEKSERENKQRAPRLVHRLDADVSGALVLAKSREAAHMLTREFARRRVRKTYWALVLGVPKLRSGRIKTIVARRSDSVASDASPQLARHRPARKRAGKKLRRGRSARARRLSVAPAAAGEDDPFAKKAKTEFSVMAQLGTELSWLELRPLTGRKHQLRVHCAAGLMTPVVGDVKFGLRGESAEELREKVKTLLRGNTTGMARALKRRDAAVEEDARLLHLFARCVEFRVPIPGDGAEYKRRCRRYLAWFRNARALHENAEVYERVPTRALPPAGSRAASRGRVAKKFNRELAKALRCSQRKTRRPKLRALRERMERRAKRARHEKYELRVRVFAPPPEHFVRSFEALGLGKRLRAMTGSLQ
uniref:Pseudouridine synthase RsuA/RluA-like domain-containing protein n=1 Tax=Erythrolobus australicus TaxID=1077150 RepID=A0A7S1TJV8_9RHOD|mmetsp:Transcript_1742/g.4635  ORF Transcript_1742/g.4635 Transcript_1742/m.4635 type:complete len:592 (+) Transcript_1742:28-1803(+)